MLETFAALLLAHVIADFLLQTNAMVATKKQVGTLFLHGAIVWVTAQIAVGQVATWELFALAVVHIAIDIVKAYAMPPRLWSFLTDQAAHLATLLAVAMLAPQLFASGAWANLTWMPGMMILTAGLILATVAGGYAVALLVAPWADEAELPAGLTNGGRLIGLLERGIIFLLIIAGQSAGIGFLIAAKSVLRFDTTSKDQRAGEYVIVGTLASFGWAMAASWITLLLFAELPPLGFGGISP